MTIIHPAILQSLFVFAPLPTLRQEIPHTCFHAKLLASASSCSLQSQSLHLAEYDAELLLSTHQQFIPIPDAHVDHTSYYENTDDNDKDNGCEEHDEVAPEPAPHTLPPVATTVLPQCSTLYAHDGEEFLLIICLSMMKPRVTGTTVLTDPTSGLVEDTFIDSVRD